MRVVDRHGVVLRDDDNPLIENASWTQPQVFERGDRVFITAPVQVFTPTENQIEEFAFAEHLKGKAPNDHIMWLRGQYVEADQPNMNGAQWRAGELAIKKLTPMLMPITVMHDPRTAVGTIADVALLTPEKDGVPRARLDTILAIWAHRFPEIAEEAELNAQRGTLMQSMECLSPWYECSECGRAFQKLPRGAERAMWCDHLKGSNPSAGAVDLASQSSNASRILGDVCFTGTGLIFGTRGAVGAYTEAHLEVFQEEVASYHQQAHTETASGRTHTMGLVQIEDTELAQLRTERDTAKSEATTAKDEAAQKQRDLEAAEAAKATAEQERDNFKQKAEKLEAEQAGAALATKRFGAFGTAFKAKVESLPSVKASLSEQAKSMDDEQWNARLTEVEELSGVKRDATASGGGSNADDDKKDAATLAAEREAAAQGEVFKAEEVAAFQPGVAGQQSSVVPANERAATMGKLAGIFGPPKANNGAAS
jgi:hypothetical protein